jgi:hypothetical protein
MPPTARQIDLTSASSVSASSVYTTAPRQAGDLITSGDAEPVGPGAVTRGLGTWVVGDVAGLVAGADVPSASMGNGETGSAPQATTEASAVSVNAADTVR